MDGSTTVIVAVSLVNGIVASLLGITLRFWLKERKCMGDMVRSHDVTLYGNPRDGTDKGLVGKVAIIHSDVTEVKEVLKAVARKIGIDV